MNIKRFALVLMAIFTLACTSAKAKTLEFTIGSPVMYKSDSGISASGLEAAPYTVNDRTMIPVRIVSENFDCEVKWLEETNQVQIKNDSTEILLTLGMNEAYVNGEKVVLDAPPEEINGRTMVPLRFISEALEKTVSYIPVTDQVVISDEPVVMSAGGFDFTIEDYRYLLFKDGVIGDEISEESVAEVSNLLFENAIIARKGLTEKYLSLNYDKFHNINKYLNENRDDIYAVSLMAPVATWQTLSAYASEYIDLESKEEFGKYNPEEIYRNEYACVKRILISNQLPEAEEIINDCLQKIVSGEESFDALSEKYSEDPASKLFPDGHIFSKGEMTQEFEDVVFSLDEGEISPVIQSSYGYYIAQRLPLPEMDRFISYTVENEIHQQIITDIHNLALKDAEVTKYMTDSEIAELLSK